ncbi:MAG TPA: hypothetical protein VJT81_12430 [Burkholderiales bacterium]|nr:hypothetical protein [Burkholderiales bacterium]
MSFSSGLVHKSYVKTTVACLVLVLLALLLAFFGLYWLPNALGPLLAALTVLIALGAATLACASAVVLARYKRGALGERDLFLELNQSREAAAIKAGGVARTSRVRRWLAQRLLGHDFVVGDLVEVKAWTEIRATLDERGCLDQLPFMPEMLTMCGQRAYVFRCVHRLFDYRKTRRMRHMDDGVLLVEAVCDGSKHGGCEAACHTIWKSAWLRRVERADDTAGAPASSDPSDTMKDTAVLRFGTQAPRYACQLTQLNAASRPIGNWSVINFLRPLIAGNVAPAAFAVGWLTHLFNELQRLRHGVGFPEFEATTPDGGRREEIRLEPGDQVVVRPSGEIRATLNDQFVHRGMGFELDMLKHCGRRYCIQTEIRKLIDIVTGEMRTMKTPAYILRDVHFSGERQQFNAQHEPLFWRGVWLRREGGVPPASSHQDITCDREMVL